MTFPRRLTPSDKERATIVQQRMTPGGALGVGSRHVRPGDSTGSNGSTSRGGAVLGSGWFATTTFVTFGRADFTGAIVADEDGDISSYVAVSATGDLELLQEGWYQAAVKGVIGAPSGTKVGLALNLFNGDGERPDPIDDKTADDGGQANLWASTLPFYNHAAGNAMQSYVQLVTPGTGSTVRVHVVKLAD